MPAGYQIELRHLQYFSVLAEELHYRKAAERLFISQPGLSRQIKQMEELYGTELLVRNKRVVELTAAGRYLKREIDVLTNHLASIQKQVKLLGQGKVGELRIGFLGSAAQQAVPDLLEKLAQQHPLINTTLEELSNTVQVELLLKNNLDIGFVRLAGAPKGLQIRSVFRDTFSLVLPQSHALSQDTFERMDQFREETFILFSSDYSPYYYDLVMSIFEDGGFTPHVSHKAVSALAIYKLVEKGLGIAIVPTSLKHGYELAVKFIDLADLPQRTDLSVLWNPTNRNPSLLLALNALRDE